MVASRQVTILLNDYASGSGDSDPLADGVVDNDDVKAMAKKILSK